MKITAIAVAMCCFSMSAAGAGKPVDMGNANPIEVMQTGRYTYVKNTPPEDQLNPLRVVIKTRIPQSVETVGQAIGFLLARSGYTLIDKSAQGEEVQALLGLPLPQVHRNIGPMTLDQALHTLGGDAFELVIDPVRRKVAYELSTKLAGSE